MDMRVGPKRGVSAKEPKLLNHGPDREYSLEGLMLKLQYFGPPDAKRKLIGKDHDAGKG